MYHLYQLFPYTKVERLNIREGFEVIKVAIYDDIREMYFNKGLSKREIAKRLGIHRNTVSVQ